MNRVHASYTHALGKRIRTIREERRWSQRELSERSGVRQDTISRIELGIGVARIDTLDLLARALGFVLVVELVEREGTSHDSP